MARVKAFRSLWQRPLRQASLGVRILAWILRAMLFVEGHVTNQKGTPMKLQRVIHGSVGTMVLSAALMVLPDAFAQEVIETGAPGVLDTPGATYVLTKDVTAEYSAFMIKGDDITLDLGGHTVTYGTAVGVDRSSGVFLRPAGGEEPFKGVPKDGFGGGDRFTLRNGRIVQGPQPIAEKLTIRNGRVVSAAGPVPGRYCFAIYVRGCRGLEISNVTTEVNSRDTDNLYIRECADIQIHDNHCISKVREITDRHYPGTGVITVAGVRGPIDIHRNVIDGGGQWGIRVAGGRELTGHLVLLHHNIIRHRSYTTNGYAIGAAAPNMRIYANVIKPEAGRGVHLTGSGIDFFNNIVDVKEKPNPEYPRTRAHGIKLEGCRHTLVHHNFSRAVAAEGYGDAAPLDFSVRTHSANRVFNNTVVAQRKPNAGDFWAASINLYSSQPRSLTQVHDNIFKTNHRHLRADWGGGRGFDFANNRFETIDDPQDYQFWLFAQSSRAESRNLTFLDNQLAGHTDYRRIGPLRPSIPRQGIDARILRTANVNVVDPAGKGIAGALVTAFEDGKEVASAVSGDDGKAALALLACRIVGDREKPIAEHGPYDVAVQLDGRMVQCVSVDPVETTTLDVTATDPNRKLYVYAGWDQRKRIGETAILDGTVTVVGQAGEPKISWERVSGSSSQPIVDPNLAQAKVVMNKWGSCTFELTARLGDEVAKDRVSVRADAKLTPAAVALAPKAAKLHSIVQLDGTTSTDPRGFPKSEIGYVWRQIEGPEAILSSNEWPDPVFYPTEAGTYAFDLTVSNPLRTSKPTRCTVKVE